jgi:alkylated DNA repair protein alkB homolog 1
LLQLTEIKTEKNQNIPEIGLLSRDQWKVFKFKNHPGLILIKNPFTSVGQRYWIQKLLQDYTKNPNPNNLLPSRFNEKVIKDFWKALNTESDEQQRRLIKKSMRWSTLGYHYDWTNKIYDENFKNEFPPDLHKLVSVIAEALGFKDYKSEAAIVNFYPIGSTLSAHTDHSEFCLDSPLFSISFGQSAIFLIGGHEREDEAVPILLNSGDILVMSRESRLCYHAVPRVFRCDRRVWNDDEQLNRCSDLDQEKLLECLKAETWKPFENYLTDSRINVNVRQVNK